MTPLPLPATRRPVTVCIAAVCYQNNEAKIVLCTDAKATSPLGSKELILKDHLLSQKWHCLKSGGDDDLNALMPLLKARPRGLGLIDETNIVSSMRTALQDRKLERCNEFTQGRYGLPYAEFLQNGKQQLPEDLFLRDISAISRVELNIDCIVAGFLDDGFPMLMKLDGTGRVTVGEDFLVAGEGAYLAQSALMHRQYYDTGPLDRAIYCVFEAKKYAERVSTVGNFTHLAILSHDGTCNAMQADGGKYLETLYDRYSPQPISDPINILPEFFKLVVGPPSK
jgi:hypothetical protein